MAKRKWRTVKTENKDTKEDKADKEDARRRQASYS